MAVIQPAAPFSRTARPSLDQIRRRLAAFCAGHGITRAIVFGSYARGTQTRRSDLDLVIVMDTKKRFLDRYDDVKTIHDHLPDVHVEMLIYTEDELRAIAHRPFIRRILREGIVIHDEEKNQAESVRWLDTARGNLATARVLLSNGRYAHSCFHAQQAAEKAMKSSWYSLDHDPWGHSVRKLIDDLKELHANCYAPAGNLDNGLVPSTLPRGASR